MVFTLEEKGKIEKLPCREFSHFYGKFAHEAGKEWLHQILVSGETHLSVLEINLNDQSKSKCYRIWDEEEIKIIKVLKCPVKKEIFVAYKGENGVAFKLVSYSEAGESETRDVEIPMDDLESPRLFVDGKVVFKLCQPDEGENSSGLNGMHRVFRIESNMKTKRCLVSHIKDTYLSPNEFNSYGLLPGSKYLIGDQGYTL